MAEVTGFMGKEEVQLNNAATEATLLQLLKSSQLDNKLLAKIAEKAGVEMDEFKESIDALSGKTGNLSQAASEAEKKTKTLGDRFVGLSEFVLNLSADIRKLIQGTYQASDLFGTIASTTQKLSPVLSTVATGFAMLARYQEEAMVQFQQMSSVGANFGGSLTNMRIAAASTYMTLEEFGDTIIKNSDTLARMGDGVTDGTKNFAKLSNTLISSQAGEQLLALGYTTKDLNDGLLNYIAVSGGRTSAEMKNAGSQRQLAEGAAEYLQQLNGLAEITGKSRKAQEEELAAASKNAAFQSYMAGLDEEGKKKANIALAQALAVGGKGAVDALQSKLMGVAPDKAGALFMATAQNTALEIDNIANMVGDSSKKTSDMNAAAARAFKASQTDISKFSKESLFAIIRGGGPLAEQFQALGITANKIRDMDEASIQRMLEKTQLESQESANMALASKNLKEFGQAIVGLIGPIASILTPLLNYLTKPFSWLGNWMNSLGEGAKSVVSILGTLVIGYGAYRLALLRLTVAKEAEAARGAITGKIAGTAAGGAGGAGGTLGELGKAGQGIGPVLEGLAKGLAAFANPMILLGATILAGSVAIIIGGIGAGVALAMVALGAAMPAFSEGLKSFSDINGDNLINVGKGIGALALAMAAFGAGGAIAAVGSAISQFVGGISKLFGGTDFVGQIEGIASKLGPIAPTLESAGNAVSAYAAGLTQYAKAVNMVDVDRAERIKNLLSGPSATERIASAGARVATAAADKITGMFGSEKPAAPAPVAAVDKTSLEIQALNRTMTEILKYTRETADYTRRNVDATKSLSGSVW